MLASASFRYSSASTDMLCRGSGTEVELEGLVPDRSGATEEVGAVVTSVVHEATARTTPISRVAGRTDPTLDPAVVYRPKSPIRSS